MKPLIKNDKTKGRLLIISAALLWGLAGVCVKSVPWNSISLMAVRCFFAAIVLGISKKSFKLHFEKKSLAGGLMAVLCGILYMMSIKLTTAATAIVLQYIAPVLVFLYGVIFKRVRPALSDAVIVLIVFGGCVLSFADDLDPSKTLGNVLGLLSGVVFAAQIIILSDKNCNAAEGIYTADILCFLGCLPFMFFDKKLIVSPEIIFWVVILGIFQYGMANACYSKGCPLVDKLETSLLLTIEPIFNPIPVWIVTGEKMKPLAFVGFVTVIIGVTLYALLPLLRSRFSNKPEKGQSL